MLFCHCCHRRVTLVSGTRSGSYGCDGARRRICDNRLTVRRRKVERIFFAALTERLLEPGVVRYALKRVADELKRLAGEVSVRLAGKEAELAKARQRLDRLVALVAEGHAADSGAVGRAIAQEETRVSTLEPEIAALRRGDDRPFEVPSEDWLIAQVRSLQKLLERRTPESARVLRALLGRVDMVPVRLPSGRPYYVARTKIDAFVLTEPSGPRGGPDGGSRSLRWWRRRVLHLGPQRA